MKSPPLKPPAAPSRRLNLSVQYASEAVDDLPTRQEVRRLVRAALAGGGSITVRFVDTAEGQALNRDYRNKDYATNVLSFPYDAGPPLQGDLAICAPVVAREAAEQGKALAAHYAHLIVHGVLHLQGRDHVEEAAALCMEAEERQILAALAYPDPYAAE